MRGDAHQRGKLFCLKRAGRITLNDAHCVAYGANPQHRLVLRTPNYKLGECMIEKAGATDPRLLLERAGSILRGSQQRFKCQAQGRNFIELIQYDGKRAKLIGLAQSGADFRIEAIDGQFDSKPQRVRLVQNTGCACPAYQNGSAHRTGRAASRRDNYKRLDKRKQKHAASRPNPVLHRSLFPAAKMLDCQIVDTVRLRNKPAQQRHIPKFGGEGAYRLRRGAHCGFDAWHRTDRTAALQAIATDWQVAVPLHSLHWRREPGLDLAQWLEENFIAPVLNGHACKPTWSHDAKSSRAVGKGSVA